MKTLVVGKRNGIRIQQCAMLLAAVVFYCIAQIPTAKGEQGPATPMRPTGIRENARPPLVDAGLDFDFSVSGDEPLEYPNSARYLPDEHTTLLTAGSPLPSPAMAGAVRRNDFFVAMSNELAGKTYDGTFVLQSADFRHFEFAPGFGVAQHGSAVFWAPHPGLGNCNYRTVTHFDEQYAAPGAVLQDPTLPLGNLLMIYEAEIHCPPSGPGMAAGWVSVGVARSIDGGRSWPAPIARAGLGNDWLEYGDGRYAGITLPGSPTGQHYDKFYGDSLPSAFIDDRDPSGNYYVYVPYQFTGAPGKEADARIHVARAWLGNREGRRETGQLRFRKWYQGAWSQDGRGGLEDGVAPPCGAIYGEGGAQISYNDALHRYMMTFVCTTYVCPQPGKCTPTELSLYYSTAANLNVQDWTRPRLIEHSTYPYVNAPNGAQLIDGGYPSFVSPGCAPGHLGLSGFVYVLKGDPLGARRMVMRTFTIRPEGLAPIERAPAGDGCAAHEGGPLRSG